MSMNLHMEGVDLMPQTPTHITYMCLSYNEEGKPDGGMEGVRRRFLLWLKGTLDGGWDDQELLKTHSDFVAKKTQEVLAVTNPIFYAI